MWVFFFDEIHCNNETTLDDSKECNESGKVKKVRDRERETERAQREKQMKFERLSYRMRNDIKYTVTDVKVHQIFSCSLPIFLVCLLTAISIHHLIQCYLFWSECVSKWVKVYHFSQFHPRYFHQFIHIICEHFSLSPSRSFEHLSSMMVKLTYEKLLAKQMHFDKGYGKHTQYTHTPSKKQWNGAIVVKNCL